MNKQILLFLLLSLPLAFLSAQSLRGLDKSPLDNAYFPDNFSHDRSEGEVAIVRVTYSRPQKKDREIFGKKVAYGKVWRTGANEATEIKVYQDIQLDGKALAAGTYSLFTLPGKTEWEIILNSDLDYWGAYRYNADNDVLRLTVPARTSETVVEAFTIQFKADGDGKANMILAWDKTRVEVPITY